MVLRQVLERQPNHPCWNEAENGDHHLPNFHAPGPRSGQCYLSSLGLIRSQKFLTSTLNLSLLFAKDGKENNLTKPHDHRLTVCVNLALQLRQVVNRLCILPLNLDKIRLRAAITVNKVAQLTPSPLSRAAPFGHQEYDPVFNVPDGGCGHTLTPSRSLRFSFDICCSVRFLSASRIIPAGTKPKMAPPSMSI